MPLLTLRTSFLFAATREEQGKETETRSQANSLASDRAASASA